MPSILKRRKILDANVAFRGSIGAYGKISKHTFPVPNKKEVAIATKLTTETNDDLKHKNIRQEGPSKKRKREDATEASKTRTVEKATTKARSIVSEDRARHESPHSVPSTPRKKAPTKSRVKNTDTPTKGARAFLEAFVISAPTKHQSPPTSSPEPEPEPELTTPSNTIFSPSFSHATKEIQELTDLHSAFLKALSLHYAHNGTSSPADIRALRASIERLWGKRGLEHKDIRRVIGIQQYVVNEDTSQLSLVDYGKNRICIEYDSPNNSPLPVSSLCSAFTNNIRALQKTEAPFPLAPVTPFSQPSLSTTLSKGAQRRSDLRAAALSAQPASTTSKPSSTSSLDSVTLTKNPALNSTSRTNSLLDRIRAKQAHAETLPAPRSAADSARRSALMRLEEIIPILEILVGSSSAGGASLYSNSGARNTLALFSDPKSNIGGGRGSQQLKLWPESGFGISTSLAQTKSFSMSAVVQHLQNSMRHPVAVEEAERCIRVLAGEVLPDSEWVSVTEVGKVVCVSFWGKVSRERWVKRLRDLIEAA